MGVGGGGSRDSVAQYTRIVRDFVKARSRTGLRAPRQIEILYLPYRKLSSVL